MSREVRRVPLDWQHPLVPNPYWLQQANSRRRQGLPESRLHGPDVHFRGLMDDYPGTLADWGRELADLKARRGHHWEFSIEYHLTGFQGRDDDAPVVHPFHVWVDEDHTEPVTVRDLDHLQELLVAEKEGEKPDPDGYMPVFDGDPEGFGWCLYETVSEGTPTTPVFATAEELIEHLATVGQDYRQEPMRREAAEQLVRSGSSWGSMAVIGGVLYRSDEDADRLAAAVGEQSIRGGGAANE